MMAKSDNGELNRSVTATNSSDPNNVSICIVFVYNGYSSRVHHPEIDLSKVKKKKIQAHT